MRHLSGKLRVVVAFPMPDVATIVLIGPHDDADPGIDVYTQLYALAGLETPPAEKQTKPPCCDEQGQPPSNGEIIDDLVTRSRQLARQTRRN